MKKRRTPKRPETRGRPEIPPDLRKVTLVCRVPSRVLKGFDARASAHGTDSAGRKRSSRGLEVERAFDSSDPANPGRTSDADLNEAVRKHSHAGLV